MHDAVPGDTPDAPEPEISTIVEPPRERPALFTRQDLLVGALLLVILAFGAYFRFTGQNWDDYTHLHPDERFLTGVVEAIGGPLKQPRSDNQKDVDQIQACHLLYPDTNGSAPSIFDSACSPWYPKNVT